VAADREQLSDDQNPAQGEREWWVYSEEDDGQVINADTAEAAVKKWAASDWTDVEDGQEIHAHDIALIRHFTARQVNEIPDDDMTTEPQFEFIPPKEAQRAES
jgi:hypothetical protein